MSPPPEAALTHRAGHRWLNAPAPLVQGDTPCAVIGSEPLFPMAMPVRQAGVVLSEDWFWGKCNSPGHF